MKSLQKLLLASLVMLLTVLMFVRVGPLSFAVDVVPEFRVPSLSAVPVIDAEWSAGEWDDAFEYEISNGSLTSYVRVKWGSGDIAGDFLYILIDSPWDTTPAQLNPNENIWVAFDTLNDKSTVGPQTDDYLFNNGYSDWNGLSWQGTGTGWTMMLTPKPGYASIQNEFNGTSPHSSTNHLICEFRVPLTHVGSIGSTVGFYILTIDDSADPNQSYEPPGSPLYVEYPSGAGGDSAGWVPGPNPTPAPSAWGYLTLLQRPVASFTFSPEVPDVNETITFDASTSNDLDGNITSYTWDFDDGNVTNVSTPIVNHSYSSAGSFRVNLTVTDNDGLNSSVLKAINVGVRVEFTFLPIAPNPGEAITFDASASYSRSGSIVNYAWDWGDLNSNVTANPVITHTYSEGGSYNVELTVSDNTGLNGSKVRVVNVGIPVANFTFMPSAPNLGDTVVFNATTSFDPDGNIINYSWDWGHSSSTNLTTDRVVAHIFTEVGNYDVTLTVSDNLGLNGSFTHHVIVYSIREVHFSFEPSNPNVGETVTFNASLSKDPGGAIATYTWDFDDGTITTVDTATITHIFQEKGSYDVSLKITDNSEQTSQYNNTVNVGVASVEATAPFSSRIPIIDGVWSLDEWTDANEYVINGTGGEGYILLKWGPGNITGDFLYILIDSPWDTTNSTMSGLENAFVAFDTLNDKSTVGPQTDDYLFNNGYSYWILAWQGNGTQWKRTQINYTGMGYLATRGSGFSQKSAVVHRIDELRVPLEVIGNSTSGFYVNVVDDSSDPDQKWGPEEPPTAWVEWPSSAGGDSAGWPAVPYIDPCPTPDKWGLLTLEAPMKARSSIALDISSASITIGESVTITGIVSNDTRPIPGAVIIIQYRMTGTTEWTNIATSTTGSTGTTIYSWEPAEAGTYEIRTIWDGNEAHYGAESEIETLRVTSEQLPILIIGGAIIVIVAIAAFAAYILKARKHK